MFHPHIGQPTKIKKTVYLTASIILGLLLSLNLHILIEVNYLNWLLGHGQPATFYYNCALSPILRISLLLLGSIGGYFLGNFWWRKIYIERFWEQKHK